MIDQLSGGELQRFAIAVCCVQNADVYDLFFNFKRACIHLFYISI